jgi:hypothetical protein
MSPEGGTGRQGEEACLSLSFSDFAYSSQAVGGDISEMVISPASGTMPRTHRTNESESLN